MTKKRSEVFNKKIKICLTYSIFNFHSIHVKKQKFRAFHLLLKWIHSENGNQNLDFKLKKIVYYNLQQYKLPIFGILFVFNL